MSSRCVPFNGSSCTPIDTFFQLPSQHDSSPSGEITLHNVEADDFSVLLHYAYTGTINVTRDSAQRVLIAADYLSIPSVKKECEKFIASYLDLDNVCDALQFSSGYSLPILGQRAMQVLKERLPDVSATSGFRDLDPEFIVNFFDADSLVLHVKGIPLKSIEREKLILSTVLQYLSDREEIDPQVLSSVFRTVRLVAIPKDDIKKCFKNYKHLKKREEIKSCLDMREVAVEFLQQRGQDYSLTVPIGGAGIENVPDAWFRKRKLASYKIEASISRYAAGGQVGVVRGPPSFLYDNPELEIESVEIWIRRWDGRPVIGGLTLTYRPNPSLDLEEADSSEDSHRRRYTRGRCESRSREDYFCATFEPGEYVVKVMVNSGYLIDRLGFVTNSGRELGPYGGPGGGEHTEVAPEGGQAYLYDINCGETITQGLPAIYNLMFRWIILEWCLVTAVRPGVQITRLDSV